jgi:hypothetical protein
MYHHDSDADGVNCKRVRRHVRVIGDGGGGGETTISLDGGRINLTGVN